MSLISQKTADDKLRNPQKSSIFTNGKLEKIALYQKPNLMYNLTLYRKKKSYNTIIEKNRNEKNIRKFNNEQKLFISKSERQTCMGMNESKIFCVS